MGVKTVHGFTGLRGVGEPTGLNAVSCLVFLDEVG